MVFFRIDIFLMHAHVMRLKTFLKTVWKCMNFPTITTLGFQQIQLIRMYTGNTQRVWHLPCLLGFTSQFANYTSIKIEQPLDDPYWKHCQLGVPRYILTNHD